MGNSSFPVRVSLSKKASSLWPNLSNDERLILIGGSNGDVWTSGMSNLQGVSTHWLECGDLCRSYIVEPEITTDISHPHLGVVKEALDKLKDYFKSNLGEVINLGTFNDKFFWSNTIMAVFGNIEIRGDEGCYRDFRRLSCKINGEETLFSSAELRFTMDGKAPLLLDKCDDTRIYDHEQWARGDCNSDIQIGDYNWANLTSAISIALMESHEFLGKSWEALKDSILFMLLICLIVFVLYGILSILQLDIDVKKEGKKRGSQSSMLDDETKYLPIHASVRQLYYIFSYNNEPYYPELGFGVWIRVSTSFSERRNKASYRLSKKCFKVCCLGD